IPRWDGVRVRGSRERSRPWPCRSDDYAGVAARQPKKVATFGIRTEEKEESRMKKFLAVLTVLLVAFVLAAGPGAHRVEAQFDPPASFDVMEKTIPQLQAAMASGAVTSKQLVKLYLERIAAYDPTLNAFITVNPRVVAEAQHLDLERARGQI